MTVPPGGPHGQDPYGQDPYGANPYGQQPYWGGQQQGQPHGQPQGQPDGQPQGQPQGPPQGGSYPYPPPGGPYGRGPDPYGVPGYPPQQFTQPGQQVPGGWQPGGYPPGPPPSNSKMPWLIVAGIAVLGIIVLVVVLVIALNSGNDSPSASPSETTSAPTTGPESSMQTATGCTPNVSGGNMPIGDTVTAGKLSFPASAAPDWSPFVDDQNPNLIDAVGLGQEVPGASQWMMQLEVAITNFVPGMDVGKQASTLMDCIADGPGYVQSSPTLGSKKTSSTTIDGVKAARVDADITIADTTRGVKGDSVTIIAVDTKPVTIFLGAVAIGDTASAAIVSKVIAELKVSKK